MTDKEILKINRPRKSCLTESEKREVRDMIYKYKDAFSLRDRISTMSCQRRRQENIRQRYEKIVLFRYIERRLLGIL